MQLPELVYFTFPDRGVRYDCRGCGACCKGHGIGLDVAGGQLVQLAARRPELVPFLRRRGDAVTAFNPRDRCWFLADDGLCRVEVEDGRAAKPASCRLFPFNRVFRIGDAAMIVDFNSVICPLQLAPAGDGVPHADVLAEIATIADPAIIGTQLPGDGAAVIAQEQPIAHALFAAGVTLEAAWAAQTVDDLAAARADVDALFAAIGAAWSAPAELAPALQLTPSLRFNELYGPRRTPAALLARMWLAWLGFCGLGERLAGRALGLQELTTVWSEQAPLMHVAARWRAVPTLKPGAIELPSSDPSGAVRALVQACIDNRKPRRPLGALIATLPGDAVARTTALKLADAIVRRAF